MIKHIEKNKLAIICIHLLGNGNQPYTVEIMETVNEKDSGLVGICKEYGHVEPWKEDDKLWVTVCYDCFKDMLHPQNIN